MQNGTERKLRPAALAFAAVSAALCLGLAYWAAVTLVSYAESRSESRLASAFSASGDDWVRPVAEGMGVTLSGTAPNEAARERALVVAGRVLSPERIRDETDTAVAEDTAEAQTASGDFGLQMMRNGPIITLLGTVPAMPQGDTFLTALRAATGSDDISDMRRPTIGAAPARWEETVAFAAEIAGLLPRASVEVAPGRIDVTAQVDSAAEKDRISTEIRAQMPSWLSLQLDITAPLPVLSPFRFAAELSETSGVSACNAQTPEGRARIEAALIDVGIRKACTLGIGAPSDDWSDAVVAGITALGEIGTGRLRMENADVLLEGLLGADPEAFRTAEATLQRNLPSLYSLNTIPPPAVSSDGEGAPELPMRFFAEATSNGILRLEGYTQSEMLLGATEAFARAQFGSETVTNDMAINADLPSGWPVRVLAGIKALASLRSGRVELTPEGISIVGVTTKLAGEEEVNAILAEAFPELNTVSLDITFDEVVAAVETGMRPSDCAVQIDRLLEVAQITFPPSETAIEDASLPIIDELATILKACPGAEFEVGGHTDSQGRETSNLTLSQARADAVVEALLTRDIGPVFLTARGYGESEPIADNDTDAGRARNRRIAFRLQTPEPEPDPEAELEIVPQAEAGPEATPEPTDDGAADAGDAATEEASTAELPDASDDAANVEDAPEATDGGAESDGVAAAAQDPTPETDVSADASEDPPAETVEEAEAKTPSAEVTPETAVPVPDPATETVPNVVVDDQAEDPETAEPFGPPEAVADTVLPAAATPTGAVEDPAGPAAGDAGADDPATSPDAADAPLADAQEALPDPGDATPQADDTAAPSTEEAPLRPRRRPTSDN